jgi:uncharacterized membrane protein
MNGGEEKCGRVSPLDSLRGRLMILMALDHARFFIAKVHPLEYWAAPLPQYPNAVSFVARLSSHLCAPGFSFLMGAGMALFAESPANETGRNGGSRVTFFCAGCCYCSCSN